MCETTDRGTICTPDRLSEGKIEEYERLAEEATTKRACDTCRRNAVPVWVACGDCLKQSNWQPGPLLVAIPALIAEVRARGREIEGLREGCANVAFVLNKVRVVLDDTDQPACARITYTSVQLAKLIRDLIAEFETEVEDACRLKADAELGRMCREIMSEHGGLRADNQRCFDPQYGVSIYRHGPDGRHCTNNGHGATFEEALSAAFAALQAAQGAHDE